MYSHLPPLNIRVYGLNIIDHKLLIIEEYFQEQQLFKFPGGGLEYGEGTIDCLKREFREEMDCEIYNIEHYYTTDFFQKSNWDDRQVIAIYYLVDLDKTLEGKAMENDTGKFYWLAKDDLLEKVHLPIDHHVLNKLIEVGRIK